MQKETLEILGKTAIRVRRDCGVSTAPRVVRRGAGGFPGRDLQKPWENIGSGGDPPKLRCAVPRRGNNR